MTTTQLISSLITRHEAELFSSWRQVVMASPHGQDHRLNADELDRQCRALLSLIRQALADHGSLDFQAPPWMPVRDLLANLARTHAQQGLAPTSIARLVLSLKEPLFRILQRELGQERDQLLDQVLVATRLIDELSLLSVDNAMLNREAVISRQQETMLELSTPVVKLWDGILALPLIGTLDSARTQVVMESLLTRVVAESTEVVIIDITGVPTVDTQVAQHLLKTITAARLMGTDCIISGIRPQIAQTIVHLGVDLTSVITKASLADAFKVAIGRRDLMVVKRPVTPNALPTR